MDIHPLLLPPFFLSVAFNFQPHSDIGKALK